MKSYRSLKSKRAWVTHTLKKRQWIVCGLVCIMLSVTASTGWARWVWVRGEHKGNACQKSRVELEYSLTQHVIELAHIELVYDGQALTCKSVSCARARLATASGVLALMGESTCLSQGLQYTLKVITLADDQTPLVYKKTIKLTHKHYAAEAGRQIARRMLKGPRLPTKIAKGTAPSLWGVGIGFVQPQQSRYDGYGLHLNIARYLRFSETSPVALRLGTSYSLTETSDFEVGTVGLDFGLKYDPLSEGVGLWLSGGMMVGYHHWNMTEREVQPLDLQEQLWGRRLRWRESESWGVAPWLEAGWIWSKGRIQPYLASRYVPLGLPTHHDWAELSFLLGLRWR